MSEGGGWGVPVLSCLAPRKLACTSGTCRARHPNFSYELHHPRWGGSLPTRAPEPGIGSPGPALPPLGPGAREPDSVLGSAQLFPLAPQGLLAPGFPKSCARQTKLRLSDGEEGGADTQSLPYLAIGKGEGS